MQAQLVGCILGTALGDALGLPYEGLTPQRAARLLGPPERQRLFFGRGMLSDDTEHTCMVAQSLIATGSKDPDGFARDLAWRLRFWLLGLPAGIGLATLRSILRLWIGYPPQRSGVHSAGNGAAMRAAVLGASLNDLKVLRRFIQASTRLTHTDPKAEWGAWAIALATRMACQNEEIHPERYLEELYASQSVADDVWNRQIVAVTDSVRQGQSTENFSLSLGLSKGVSGYVYHTVPVVLHTWLAHPRDFRAAICAAIRCGGDTDTTAALTGGIVGAAVGKAGLPAEWLQTLLEWPRSTVWMEALGTQLSNTLENSSFERALGLPLWGLLPRNLFFLLVVLYHGLRRGLPPY